MTDRVDAVPLRTRTVLQFVALGLVIYAALFTASEALVYTHGHANPFYKIATADRHDYDWLILGASHAMPLAFGDSEITIEAATGKSVINLAVQGAGPLYNRLVLEQFLERHNAKGLIYVVDSFAFQSPLWNEDRIADPGLLARTPYSPSLVLKLWQYAFGEGVHPLAALDYMCGFSKLNNRERFERDAWDGEEKFDRRYRPSARAEDERIAYLYPERSEARDALARYLGDFAVLIDEALAAGIEVKLVKMPVPASFYAKLPDEAGFDRALGVTLQGRGLSVEDDSVMLNGAEFYFDSDHLGRQGVGVFVEQRLVPLMRN